MLDKSVAMYIPAESVREPIPYILLRPPDDLIHTVTSQLNSTDSSPKNKSLHPLKPLYVPEHHLPEHNFQIPYLPKGPGVYPRPVLPECNSKHVIAAQYIPFQKHIP